MLVESSGIFSNFGAEKPPLLQAAGRQTVILKQNRQNKVKQMKHLIKFLFIGFFINSCHRTENFPDNYTFNEPLITKMNFNIYDPFFFPNNGFILRFEYDSDLRLIKKIGGYKELPTATGFSGFFSDKIYTSIIYSGQNVTTENFSSSPNFTVPLNPKYFTLNYKNQIITIEIPGDNNYRLKKLTFNYSNNKLIEIKTTFPNKPYDSTNPYDYILTYLEKFYFDIKGNLIMSEYFEQHNGIYQGLKIVRIYENYDNSINPFKRLQFLDEFFHHSLSKNNFRKFTQLQYSNEILFSTSIRSWTYNYDSNGQIIVN